MPLYCIFNISKQKNPRLASRGQYSYIINSHLLRRRNFYKTGAAILSYLFTSFHFINIFLRHIIKLDNAVLYKVDHRIRL